MKKSLKQETNINSYAAKTYLTFKTIYNFIDIFTDLYLILEVWNVFAKGYENNRNTNVALLILL